MNTPKGNQDVFFSIAEFEVLDDENKKLMENKERIEEENRLLKRKVEDLSASLQDVGSKNKEIDTLKMKVFRLSKLSLKLGRQALESKSDQKVDGSGASSDKIVVQSLRAPGQAQKDMENKMKRLLNEVNKYKAMCRDLEDNKKSEEERLRLQIERSRMGFDSKQQQKIIKSWKISSESVRRCRQMVESDITAQTIQKLKKKVEELEIEKDQSKIIIINERNIIESFRRQLLDKEKDYNHLQLKYRSLSSDFQRKEVELMKSLSLKMQELQKQYQDKIKSLKDFSSSFDEQRRKDKELKKLNDKLIVSAKESSERQKVIDYMNEILANMSQSQKVSVEKAIDLELVQFEAQLLKKSVGERQKKLQLKMVELVERVNIKIQEVMKNLRA